MSCPLHDVNSVINRIHELVQSSGLHFVIQQTPWSSYITLRRKFASPTSYDFNMKEEESAVINELVVEKEKQKHLEEKLDQMEVKLVKNKEEFVLVTENYKKTIANLNSKIEVLENTLDKTECDVKSKMAEISMIEKEKKRNYETIKDLDAEFHKEVAELKTNVEDLETFKKETSKTEKRALKKTKTKVREESSL